MIAVLSVAFIVSMMLLASVIEAKAKKESDQ